MILDIHKVFIGMCALVMISGSKFIVQDLHILFEKQQLRGNVELVFLKFCIIFAIVYLNTKDLNISLAMAVLYILLVNNLKNKKVHFNKEQRINNGRIYSEYLT
jgi:hypothetical protein